MARYLFLYSGGTTPADAPAKVKKSMEAWTAWFGKLGKAVVEPGSPTLPGKIVHSKGTKSVGAKPITGYTILQADNLDAAVALAKSCPGISEGGQLAVYELAKM